MIYRSKHRGCREMDLLLANFVIDYIERSTTPDILILEQFLEENEMDINQWILTQVAQPKKYQKLIKEILIFNSRVNSNK